MHFDFWISHSTTLRESSFLDYNYISQTVISLMFPYKVKEHKFLSLTKSPAHTTYMSLIKHARKFVVVILTVTVVLSYNSYL